jgi:hypothetical protein
MDHVGFSGSTAVVQWVAAVGIQDGRFGLGGTSLYPALHSPVCVCVYLYLYVLGPCVHVFSTRQTGFEIMTWWS